MPRKQVYGKPTRHDGFGAASSLFWDRRESSSPPEAAQRPENRPRTKPRRIPLEPLQSNEIVTRQLLESKALQLLGKELVDDFTGLSLQDDVRAEPTVSRDALSLKASSKAITTDKTKRRTVPTIPQPEISSYASARSPSQCEGRIAESKSKVTQCDSYITPLISLFPDSSRSFRPLAFERWSHYVEEHFNIIKITEATFGEVYRMQIKSRKLHPSLTPADESVLKLIPLKPPPSAICSTKKKSKAQQDREDMMSSVESVASEVRLLHRMTDIPGFVNFRELRILQGRPSEAFIEAWHEYNGKQRRGQKSRFPDPAKRASYSEQQLWAVIEMQDAGTDLEKVSLPTVFHVWDVFWRVAIAVAKAEQECRFEHRDLHLGNICVRVKNGNCQADEAKINVSDSKIGYTDLEATIIDYTYSRADMDSRTVDGLPRSGDVQVAYQEPDTEIFLGDARVDYQYEMYRHMHSAFFYSDPALPYNDAAVRSSRKSWRDFQPLTNLVWLHFILHTLLAQPESWPSTDMDSTLALMSSRDAASRKTAEKRARRLEVMLKALRDTLKIETLGAMAQTGLASAADLIWMALEEKWLDEDNIIRC